MGLSLTQKEKKLKRDVEWAGAILDGRRIPDRLRGRELVNSNGAATRTSNEYEGHFLLGDNHTTKFFDIQLAMGIPSIEENVGVILRRKLEESGIIKRNDLGFDLIVGPARGAWPIGKSLLKALNYPPSLKDIYAQRDAEGKFHFSYPYPDRRDIRTLIVDDFFVTGESIRETMNACDEAAKRKNSARRRKTTGAKENPASFYFVGGAIAVNRAPDWDKFLLNTITFWIGHALRIEAEIWAADNCPLCADGVPLYKP